MDRVLLGLGGNGVGGRNYATAENVLNQVSKVR